MKKYALLVALSICLMMGCNNRNGMNVFTLSKDPAAKFEIDNTNDAVFSAIANRDTATFMSFFSDAFKNAIDTNFRKKVFQFSDLIKNSQRQEFNEFLVKNTNANGSFNYSFGDGDSAYTFSYTTITKNFYVSMLLLTDTFSTGLLTLIYGDYNGKWKLNTFYMGRYSISGKTAEDFYKDAQKLYRQNYLVDAINTMGLCTEFQRPSPCFSYKNEGEMRDYFAKLRNETKIKYPLPFVMENINTKPEILGFNYVVIKGDCGMVVNYKTAIKISDTDALEKENNELQVKIGGPYYGIGNGAKLILYRAFNTTPEYNKPFPRYYQFVDRK